MTTFETKPKVYGPSVEAVRAVIDNLLDLHESSSSPIPKLQPSGWHAFITLQVEVPRR